MIQCKKIVAFLLFFISIHNYAQLSFCTGSKGDPIFSENFGNGTDYGPPLPAGTTNYTYIAGSANDGFYTLFSRTNLYASWHNSPDRTPDITNGADGKCLIVNANANTSGDFYKRTVSGLCINTTFEFSSWLMNVYNPSSNVCGANEIPINVRFEIWNATETTLLSSGNTGNIIGTSIPIWRQFALVFTTTNETSIVLKMKNNGLGGCGNDLAIDDIEFKSCGDLTTISSVSAVGNNFSFCENSGSIALQATTSGTSTYFYQWQTSTNGTSWTDIAGANTSSYTTPNVTLLTYFRAKVVQDLANLGNSFCTTLSSVFTLSVLVPPNNAVNLGNITLCSNAVISPLSVSASIGTSVNWYSSATGGILLQANSLNHTPTAAGTFYAEAYNISTNCKSSSRTPVTLTTVPLPTASITANTFVCPGNSGVVTFNGTPNARITYNVDSGTSQTILLNSSGNATITTAVLNSNTTYTLLNVASAVLNSCVTTINSSVSISVNSIQATVAGSSVICQGSNTILTFSGTSNAVVTYTVDGGINQTITLNSSGTATLTTPILNSNSVYSLVNVSLSGINPCTRSLSQVFTVSLLALPTATVSINQLSLCFGDAATLNFSGTPNAILTYTQNNGANQTITLNSLGAASVTISNLTTTTTIRLTNAALAGILSCSQTLSSSAVVLINPKPTASFSGNLNYCTNELINLNLSSNIVGTTFSWTVIQNGITGATSGTGNTISQILSANNLVGTANYSVTPLFNGCAGTIMQIVVTINPLPKPAITDGVICLNNLSPTLSQFYTLTTGLNATEYSFRWYFGNTLIPNTNRNSYNANQVGSYSVIATNNLTGCVSATATARVGESIQGQSLIINQSESFSENATITVTVVGGGGSFLYKLDNGSFQISNVFSNVSSGTHIVHVVDELFCTNLTASVTTINFPSFFTPNGDGYNDFWTISGFTGKFEILIFDRFGKLLKQIITNSNSWDGTYNGQALLSDDYWFTINYIEKGVEKQFRSHFTLKR